MIKQQIINNDKIKILIYKKKRICFLFLIKVVAHSVNTKIKQCFIVYS
jgi:hypothetical protein